ncbi:hypothetical protein D3C73_546260 [compost metagenome]
MHAFRRLLLTELRSRRNMSLITLCTAVLLNAVITFLMLQSGGDHFDPFVVINLLVFCSLLLFPFIHCFLHGVMSGSSVPFII